MNDWCSLCSGDLEDLRRQMEESVPRLQKAAEERRTKLEQCCQLRRLDSQASDVKEKTRFVDTHKIIFHRGLVFLHFHPVPLELCLFLAIFFTFSALTLLVR